MKYSKPLFKITALLVLSVSVFSCQPLLRAYLGVKKPTLVVSQNERMEYYSPYFEGKNFKTEIYTLADTTGFHVFDSLMFPKLFLKNRHTDALYLFNCYEDMGYDVDNFNSGKEEELTKGNQKELDYIKRTMDKYGRKIHSINDTITTGGDWDLYMANVTFMGKKLRRMSLPLSEIEGLNRFIIFDLSIDTEDAEKIKAAAK